MILAKVHVDLSKCKRKLQGLSFFQSRLLEKFCMTLTGKDGVPHPVVRNEQGF